MSKTKMSNYDQLMTRTEIACHDHEDNCKGCPLYQECFLESLYDSEANMSLHDLKRWGLSLERSNY